MQKEISGGGIIKCHRKDTEAQARIGSGPPPAAPHNKEPQPGWLQHQTVSS